MSMEMRDEAEAVASLMQHRTDLYAYLMATLRDHHAVEDLLQEVSIAVSSIKSARSRVREFSRPSRQSRADLPGV